MLAGIGWRLGVRGADWPPRMDRFRVRLGWPEPEFPGCAGLPVGLEQSQGPRLVGCETLVRGCREKLQMRNDGEGEGSRVFVVKIPSGVPLRQAAKSAEQSPPSPCKEDPLSLMTG